MIFGDFPTQVEGETDTVAPPKRATLTLKNAQVIRDIAGSHGQLTDDLDRLK